MDALDEVTPDEVTPDEVTPDEATSDEVTPDELTLGGGTRAEPPAPAAVGARSD